ncbi:hypothetical protein ACFXPX_36110 [Kitasatospora sp. NPDC059146]|uniref:hypothetical protein n=1 Tax=Kitasatospora sp. NPDC059146 TaxID=3346741 RepID=UPI0036BD8CAA
MAVVAPVSVLLAVAVAVAAEGPTRAGLLQCRRVDAVTRLPAALGRRLAPLLRLLLAPHLLLARRTVLLAVVAVLLLARLREVAVDPGGERGAAGRHDGRDEQRGTRRALFAAVRHRRSRDP